MVLERFIWKEISCIYPCKTLKPCLDPRDHGLNKHESSLYLESFVYNASIYNFPINISPWKELWPPPPLHLNELGVPITQEDWLKLSRWCLKSLHKWTWKVSNWFSLHIITNKIYRHEDMYILQIFIISLIENSLTLSLQHPQCFMDFSKYQDFKTVNICM